MEDEKFPWAILAILTLIGAVLRFYHLGYNSLWLDEASTLTIAAQSLPEIWQMTAAGEFNPPLFYWIEHFMLAAGTSEAVLRFVPALLGTLTIPLIYFAGKEFVDSDTGIIAAAAFTVSPFLIFYSQEARAYAPMLFFITAALVFYFRAIRTNRPPDWFMFGLLAALAFWTHFYALVMVGALALYAVYALAQGIRAELKEIVPPFMGLATFMLITLPLVLVAARLFALRTGSAPTFGIQGEGIVLATFQQVSGFGGATVLLLVLFIAGILAAFKIGRDKGIFLTVVILATFVISTLLSYLMPMQPRYLIFLAIPFFIAVSCSARLFPETRPKSALICGFILLLVVVNAPYLTGYYTGYTKEDWRGFSADLQNQTRPGDIVVTVPGYISQPLDYYYSNATDGTIELSAYAVSELEAVRGTGTVYYVVTPDIYAVNPGGEVRQWLDMNTTLLIDRPGISVRVFGSGNV